MSEREQSLVLVVDDDPTVRLLARGFLEKAGFDVAEAANGLQSMVAFEERRPDIILLDVDMPEMDGFTACQHMRARPGGEDVPILMITGLDDLDSVNRAYQAGATDFATKPINWPLLAHRVRYVLRASHAFRRLKESEARLANAQHIARLGDWDWDLTTGRVRWSEETHRLFGATVSGLGGTYAEFLAHVHMDDRAAVQEAIDACLKEQTPLDVEHRVNGFDAKQRVVHLRGTVVPDAQGRAVRVTGTAQDVTERKQAEAEIRRLAYYDSLTGLPNREFFKELLGQALEIARRHERQVAILFLDLDNFKRVNDTLGHSAGDLLLKAVADRLQKSLRGSDAFGRNGSESADRSVARLGGDEFIVLLSELERVEDAARVARRLLSAVPRPVTLEGQEIIVTPSIGIAVYPYDGETVESLLKNADTAMYFAKKAGKSVFQFYSESMNSRSLHRLNVETKLHKALEQDELLLHYQPLVEIRSGRMVGCEALLRWLSPELGMVSPGDFIPVAEESGQIIPMGDWVLRAACARNKAWQEQGLPPVRVSVNLSSLQFQMGNLADSVQRVLNETGLDPRYLELEITETIMVRNVEQNIRTLHKLKDIGLSFAVDDFGTGYSSLSYLKRLPIDTVKIDRAFVKDILQSEDDTAITSAIIALAHSLNLKVVAEGVETERQLEFLLREGCDQMQGFLYSRPVPAEDLAGLLAKGGREGWPPTRT